MVAATRRRPAKQLPFGVLLVVLFTFVAWSLRVAFLDYDGLSDLTLAGVGRAFPGRPVGPAGRAGGPVSGRTLN